MKSSPPGPEPPSPADQLETGLLDLVKVQPCPCGDASGLAQIHPNGSVYCVECGAALEEIRSRRKS